MALSRDRVLAHPDAPDDFAHDFHSPYLQNLDSSLRCPICGDLFVAPLLFTACSHSFCSHCIHQHLAAPHHQKNCPSCFKDVTEAQLRPNLALDAVVKAWSAARSVLLQLDAIQAQADTPAIPAASASTSKPSQRRVKAETSSPPLPPSRSTRSLTRDAQKAPSNEPIQGIRRHRDERDGGSSDIEIIEPPNNKVARSAKGKKRSKPGPGGGDDDESDLFVACPVCQTDWPSNAIATHAALCNGLKPTQTKAAWDGLFAGKSTTREKDKDKPKSSIAASRKKYADEDPVGDRKLAIISFKGRKLKELQAMLVDLGLPTTFPSHLDRAAAYSRRLTQWTVAFNANLDLLPDDPRRKTKEQLRRDLDRWEHTMDHQVKLEFPAGIKGEKLAKEYAAKHAVEFRELIDQAKAGQAKQAARMARVSELTGEIDQTVPDSKEPRRASTPSDPPPLPSPGSDDDFPEGDFDDSSAPSSVSRSTTKVTFAETGRKRARSRSSSPFDPEGPKPSQRVREEELASQLEEDTDEESSRENSDILMGLGLGEVESEASSP